MLDAAAHLDDDQVLALIQGELTVAELAQVRAHLDTCRECVALVASVAPHSPTAPDEVGPIVLPRGPVTIGKRYEVRRAIGAGGMGVVFEAFDLHLHRVIALKLLRHQHEDAPGRMVREARAMAVLSHPNVVAVYDVGTHEGAMYVAMELVDGVTLRDWAAAAPREPALRLRVLCDAGRGLAASHAAGFVHRDFKPDNVLVSRDHVARVTDFGLARRVTGEPSEPACTRTVPLDASVITRTGMVIGTPAYMAPEQAAGRACDARADQFSFCVTAWELLFGVRPFAGQCWSEIRANIEAGRIADVVSGLVSIAIERALRRGLSLDPADRHPSMNELLAVLARDARPMHLRPRRVALMAVASALSASLGVAFATNHTRAAVAAPAAEFAVTQAVSPAQVTQRRLDVLRWQRSALLEELRHRTLRVADLASDGQRALAALDTALDDGRVDDAAAQLVIAETAVARCTTQRR